MKRCGTCKHWRGEEFRGWRQCQRIEHYTGYPAIDPTERAIVVDGSGYLAALRCKTDFGCVYHEPREERGEG